MIKLNDPITPDLLLQSGFQLDLTFGHPIYTREAVESVEGCHCALHVLPAEEDTWLAEIHNWQSDDGEAGRKHEIASIPKPLRHMSDVQLLCAVIADEWMTEATVR